MRGALVSLWLLLGSFAALAQSPIAAFPPGTFSNKAALDGTASIPFGFAFVVKAQQLTPTVGGTVCDFGTLSFGAADSTRQIVVEVSARSTASADISSISIDGSAGSQVASANISAASGNGVQSTIWLRAVPSNTTGNITATYSAAVLRCEVAVYRMVGTTATASSGGTSTTASGTTLSATLTIPSGGAAIGGGVMVSGPTNATGTNLTIDVNEALGAGWYAAGSNTSGSGSTTLTLTYNVSSSGSGAFATFSP